MFRHDFLFSPVFSGVFVAKSKDIDSKDRRIKQTHKIMTTCCHQNHESKTNETAQFMIDLLDFFFSVEIWFADLFRGTEMGIFMQDLHVIPCDCFLFHAVWCLCFFCAICIYS